MERAAPNITLTSVKWKSRLVLAYVRGLPRRIQGQPPRPGDYTPAHGRHPAGMFRGQARFYDSGAPLKLSRALAKIPVDRYRLPSDGRKWQHIARERMSLAEWLGVHGDGDGSHIYPAIETMRKHFGWSRRKVCYLLRDLEQLKVLVKDGYHGERGPRQRQLIPSALSEQECKIAPAGVQDRPKPECKIEEPECTVTLHTTDTRPSVSEDRRSNRQKAQGDSGDAPTDPKTGSAVAASERFRKIPSREDQEPQPIPTIGELLNIAVDEIYVRKAGWDDYYSLDGIDGPKSASAVAGWIVDRAARRKNGTRILHHRGYFRSALRQFLQDNEAPTMKLDRFSDFAEQNGFVWDPAMKEYKQLAPMDREAPVQEFRIPCAVPGCQIQHVTYSGAWACKARFDARPKRNAGPS